ncbi:MAG TPA: CopG family transcriptional regulator [Cyanobacteria bacterium UBA11149]|nr:CopG family transcriptional regulator [Cyanobacteria bacterium UBA11367]HBE56463.1 CopG family transcriptional regulator [Cyanobacteria bacterium UBA11366]HBK65063.1 CopG family transcriptional regulator [Cyanobacteria bacterium UBA11166]HBR75986.1 CopG family transcriptional regulator [Cyanobacteria bacterium UBA11159]HBS72354.1 CopG family transcriptional regulator [Cyanobacteria bacterium UBA11153]HBW89073.1 CopG family transcriptional regulator [Cyanobacteria bacterium UBA11149]HCA9676
MKTKRLDIRLTDYEVQQLEAEAIRRGMTKSELIRSLISRFPVPSPVPCPNAD